VAGRLTAGQEETRGIADAAALAEANDTDEDADPKGYSPESEGEAPVLERPTTQRPAKGAADKGSKLRLKLSEQKIVLLGDCGVGKSQLVASLQRKPVSAAYTSTVGIEHHRLELDLLTSPACDVKIKLNVWDLAGESSFGILAKAYFKSVKGAMIVFDVADPKSFQSVEKWVNKIRAVHPQCPLFLVGNKNKMDTSTTVRSIEVQHTCEKLGIAGHALVSARSGDNVEAAFKSLFAAVALQSRSAQKFPYPT
jgi:small GTP-binding protein